MRRSLAGSGEGRVPAAECGVAPTATLAALVVLVVVAFAAAAVWVIDRGYRVSVDSAEAGTLRTVQVFDDAVERFFGRTGPVMLQVADDFFRAGGAGFDAAVERARLALSTDRRPMALGIVDAGGRVVGATDDRIGALLVRAVRNRPALFRPPLEPELPKLIIVPAAADQAAPGEEPWILFGWRVSGRDGVFAVVVEAVGAAHLRSLVTDALGGDGATLALVTTGGDVLFSRSREKSEVITETVRRLLPPDRLAGTVYGSERGRLESNGALSLLAFHRVGETPVVVVVATTGDQALGSWRILVLAGSAIVLGLFALVGGLAAIHIRAVGRARRELERLVRERTLKEGRIAERLLAAERLTHVGHWEHDLCGSADYWSAETYQILGMVPEREISHVERLLSVIHPADRDAERTARVLALTGVKPYDVRVRILHRDGAARHVQLQAEVLRDDGGESVKLIGTILDVTERVNFESCLRESEERYRKTFEAAQDALFLVDRDSGLLIDANSAATSLYGYPRDELLGMCWERVVSVRPACPESVCAEISSGLLGAETAAGPARHRRRDGTELFVDLSVAEAELSGRAVGIVAVRDVTARVESEARLVRTTELLTDAERIAHLGYWDWDRVARTHHWSDEYWRILGLDPISVRPGYRTFIAQVHPDDRDRVTQFPLGVGGHGQMGSLEFRILRPDGAMRQLSSTVRVERNEAGEIVRLFAIQMDVTERKQVEIALAESHATLLSVINATHEDSVMLITADGTIQVANDRAARSFGCTTADICGRELRAMIAPESRQRWQRCLDQVVTTGEPLRFEHSRGAIVFDAHLSPALSHTGRLVGVAVFERDVTARKQVEINLRLLTRAIEQSPLSVVITDRDGRIVYVNPHFVAATGYSGESVFGKDPSLFKSGYTSPSEYRRLWSTITCGQVWQGEFHNRMKNGELHWESASIAPVRDDQGDITTS